MSASKRVLVTGVQTYWGYRVARALEARPDVEAIVCVAPEDPRGELERAEYVRVGSQHALLRRIVDAARIDTVIDTRLVVDSITTSPRLAHENNVIGTMNILAACSGRDTTVRKFIFKSSTHYYGSEQDDPSFFTESMRRPHAPRTPLERDIVEAEAAINDFNEKQPDTCVTILRCTNVLGPDVMTSLRGLAELPFVPAILGFDPRLQFVHEDDVAGALLHSTEQDLPGVFNVAADGVLALSEVAGLLGKPFLPFLPPWGTGLALTPLRRLGVRVPPELMNLLRFGRGVDNRRLKATGFDYRYTTREAVLRLGEHLRLSPILKGAREPYRYEREVEEFLRWSPSVQGSEAPLMRMSPAEIAELQKMLDGIVQITKDTTDEPAPAAARQDPLPTGPEPVLEDYNELEAEEIIALLGSLERRELEALRELESDARSRPSVLHAIDSVLARAPA
ncbi:MAG TPA: NAD-dependent epimerase/dehydratase family protein [Thermoleophilaceae bacterium]|nr:NAD-dependent epimerase/dehydratase family protein [Thermoleophilaceae bacterium]